MPSSEVWDDGYPPDGGRLRVTLPAGAGLRNTQIVIKSFGKNPLSYQQLITIAKSLTPVG